MRTHTRLIMSSDLRLKKLRGSGGYIMASVNDEQQRKGNLGGPDLFLAPIGRIDSELISKFFCNTCERDYEGAPKIQYENPNEEVADNLILVEKGQYACTTCGSTIAEYREFKKPDELAEVGAAKPMESFNTDIIDQDESKFESLEQVMPAEPSITKEIIEQPISTFEQSNPENVTKHQEKISSIVGMAVFDSNARKIGTAKQVGVDSSQSLVLVIATPDGNDVTIPWNQIKSVGEIILLGEKSSSSKTVSENPKCPSCNFENKQGSKFCEQCGTKL